MLPYTTPDRNLDDSYLDDVRIAALEQLRNLPPAPSAGLLAVPRESVARHTGIAGACADDDLDIQIRRAPRPR